jgi:heat shock protein HslJ
MVFEAEPEQSLELVEWEVTEFATGPEQFVRPVKGATISFSFRGDGAVVGNGGCNLFKSPYTRDGERLTIEAPVMTHRKCSGIGIPEQEQAFLTTLAAVKGWTLRGEALELLLAGGERAVTAERPAR